MAGGEALGGSSACGSCGEDEMGRGRGRGRGPRGGRGSEESSFATGGTGGGMGRVGSGFVGVETESCGKERGRVGRGGRGGLGQQQDSPLGFCSPTATTTTTAATEKNDDDDDEEEEEEEEDKSWDLIPTPPSPLSTTTPAPTLPGNGHESPDPSTAFHRSANPSPSSRSVTGSTSSSDAKWAGGLLHDPDKVEKDGEENDDSSLVFGNEQESAQNHFPGSGVGGWSDGFSSFSSASQREREAQQQEEHQRLLSRGECYPPRASGRVHKAVERFSIPGETERERGGYEGVGTRSPGGGELLGSSGEDGFGGGGEMRGQGDGGEEGWEIV